VLAQQLAARHARLVLKCEQQGSGDAGASGIELAGAPVGRDGLLGLRQRKARERLAQSRVLRRLEIQQRTVYIK